MQKTALFIPLSILSTSLLLVGCGGGGGGGGSSVFPVVSVPVVPTANSPGLLDAISNEVDYISYNDRAIDINPRAISKTSTADFTYDTSGNLSKLVITTLTSSLTWDVASGGSSSSVTGFPDQLVLQDSANTYAVVLIDRKTSAWDYQTFGAWRTGFGTGTGTFGGLSAGELTQGASIPVTGNATFTGKLLGTYVNATGVASFVEGGVSVTSDFAGRSLAFSTNNTNTYNLSNGATFLATGLDMSGTLTYSSGVNLFSGVVTAPVAGLTGNATGAFYGPNAEELGGVFALKAPGTGVEFYSGSFGAGQ